MPPDFEKQSYWHERFASETCFEWLVPSSTFMPLIAPYLSASASQRILNLGSGTSDLHTHFRARGYHDVTNVDNEPRALERGREIEERVFGNARTHYAVADVTRLGADLHGLACSISSWTRARPTPCRAAERRQCVTWHGACGSVLSPTESGYRSVTRRRGSS